MLTRTRVSLISRGSEFWRRYVMEQAVSPRAMGYSTARDRRAGGGDGVTDFAAGDQVVVSAPHAQ